MRFEYRVSALTQLIVKTSGEFRGGDVSMYCMCAHTLHSFGFVLRLHLSLPLSLLPRIFFPAHFYKYVSSIFRKTIPRCFLSVTFHERKFLWIGKGKIKKKGQGETVSEKIVKLLDLFPRLFARQKY